MVVDGIRCTGRSVRLYERPSDLEGASHLLIPGVGQWGGPNLERALDEARKTSMTRVLWQMETLPPPQLPQNLATKFLLRPAQYRVTGPTRFVDKILVNHLAAQCEELSLWTRGEIAPRRLGLPIREARYIGRLWNRGLLDKILVSLGTRRSFLRSMGIESKLMPFGYHHAWGRPIAGKTKDIDVLYIGSSTPRRRPMLEAINKLLETNGFQLTIIEGGCHGEERTELLNRSKVFLQLRQYPWELPRPRMMMAMACKTLFATESFHDTQPFRPKRHFVMAAPESLAETLVEYLCDDARRLEIVERSFNFVTQELAIGNVLVRAMND